MGRKKERDIDEETEREEKRGWGGKKERKEKDGSSVCSVRGGGMMRLTQREIAGERMNPVVRALQQAERGRGKHTHTHTHTHTRTHTHTQPFTFLQGAAEAVWSQQPLHGSMTYFETMLPSPVMVKNPSLALSRFISHILIPESRCLPACPPSPRC